MAFDNALILRAQAALSLGSGLNDSATATVIELDGTVPNNAHMVALVNGTDADAVLTIDFQMSTDGTNYRNVAQIQFPAGFAGVKSVRIGKNFRAFRRTPANVQCRAVCTAVGAAGAYTLVGIYISSNGEDISGKTALDVLDT